MNAQATKTFPQVADEKVAPISRSQRGRIRAIGFWIVTFVVVFELAAGSVLNLQQIEWVRIQLHHLGYPLYYTFISGAWQIGGAAAIIAPGFPRLKEWAYAGAFFTWSGAVASHLLAGDSVHAWLPPLVFAMVAIASWALRPADRRLPNAAPAPDTRPLAWAVPIGVLLLPFVVSFLTLPAANVGLHKRAGELGWIAR